MKLFRLQFTSLLLVNLIFVTSAQIPAPTTKRAADIRNHIERLSLGARISVISIASEESYGTLLATRPDGFTFHDIDKDTDLAVRYIDLKKVKDGYGGYNSATGKHTDHTKSLVVTCIAVAGLVAIIIAAGRAQ